MKLLVSALLFLFLSPSLFGQDTLLRSPDKDYPGITEYYVIYPDHTFKYYRSVGLSVQSGTGIQKEENNRLSFYFDSIPEVACTSCKSYRALGEGPAKVKLIDDSGEPMYGAKLIGKKTYVTDLDGVVLIEGQEREMILEYFLKKKFQLTVYCLDNVFQVNLDPSSYIKNEVHYFDLRKKKSIRKMELMNEMGGKPRKVKTHFSTLLRYHDK